PILTMPAPPDPLRHGRAGGAAQHPPRPGARNTRWRAALRAQNNREYRDMAEHEKETVVHTDGGGGGGGTLLAVVLLIALLVVLFLLFGRGLLGGGGTEKIDADVKIDTPAGGGGQ
ncbi:MAG: hypothetical protein M3N07_09795, partial [Pseudomonadota bacterium]|nr:hypothetical protein [Pseudomonadota bacterium]